MAFVKAKKLKNFKMDDIEKAYDEGREQGWKDYEEKKKRFVKELIEKIEDAQEDYANLNWVNKEQAIKIIKEIK